jgi:hypothetical protein
LLLAFDFLRFSAPDSDTVNNNSRASRRIWEKNCSSWEYQGHGPVKRRLRRLVKCV